MLIPTCRAWQVFVQRGTQYQTPRLSKAIKKERSFGDSGYILLVVPFTTFCLGTWQVKRRAWKLGLIEELERKTQSEPICLPPNLEEVSDLEYRRVTFRGEFDHSHEMLISPRSNVLREGGGLVSAGNQTGANVVTPFKLSGRDNNNNYNNSKEEWILVNRGWVPSTKADPRTRREGQIQGEVEVSGIVRVTEQRSVFMPKDGQQKNNWLYRDVDAMARYAGTAPVFVDLDLKSSVPNGPLGGQTRVSLRNEHISYIITWYSLSAITFFMWYRRYRHVQVPESAISFIMKQKKQS